MPHPRVAGALLRITLKLTRFNVIVLTMHRWFDISAATKDLQFEPIIPYEEGWTETIAWFKEHWRPTFAIDDRFLGIADQSEAKIKIQSDGTMKKTD